MKKILLVLPFSGVSDRSIATAVKRAAGEKASLAALYLLEGSAAENVFDAFSDIGFIGDRPSEDLSRLVMKEARQQGYEALGRVQIKAMEEGVSFEPFLEENSGIENVLSIIEKTSPEAVFIVERKKRSFFKYFKRTLADELKERASCEVVVVNEEWDEQKEEGNVKDVDGK